MGLNNIVLLSQVTGYVIALIFSLCIVIPMSLHQDEFRFVYNINTRFCCIMLYIVVGGIVYYFQVDAGKKLMVNCKLIGHHKDTAIIQFL